MGYIKETLIMKFDCNYMYTHVQIYINVCLRLMKNDVISKIGD